MQNEINKAIKILEQYDVFTKNDLMQIKKALGSFHYQHHRDYLELRFVFHDGLDYSLFKKISALNLPTVKFDLSISPLHLPNSWWKIYISQFLDKCDCDYLNKMIAHQTFKINDEHQLVIEYFYNDSEELWKKIQPGLLDHLNHEYHMNLSGILVLKNDEHEKYEASLQKAIDEKIRLQDLEYQNQQKMYQESKPYYFKKNSLKDDPTPINELNEYMNSFNVVGEIFKINSQELANGSTLYSIYINDHTSSIMLTLYAKQNAPAPDLKVGDWIKANAYIDQKSLDRYGISGRINAFEKHPPLFLARQDLAPKKRIEFCFHTKMSAYDGLIEVNELKNQLQNFQHSAFGITDRYNVQNFPEIMKAFKNGDIKPIYGVELSWLPEYIPAVLRPISAPLSNQTYVVFDIETTGLYPNYNDVIEFGAVKLVDGHIVDFQQFLIKPNMKISLKTQEITGIKEQDLENQIDQKSGLLKIKEYLGDAILVAHNGNNFDLNFLNNKFHEYGIEPITNPSIDTLIISRALNPTYKSHTLENLCKKNSIEYNVEDAHRADYDADVLAQLWLKMIFKFQEEGITNLNQINDLVQSHSLYTRSFRDNLMIYAKDQQGIRAIYEIISLAHTKTLYGVPTTYFKTLEPFRDHILIANSPIESDVFLGALSKTDEELKIICQKYDFLLIPSPDGFSHEINQGNINLEDVKNCLNKLVRIGNELKIPIVVTSNPYYLNPEDKQFHNVYVMNYVLNKKRHRFYKFGTGPIMHFKTTEELIQDFQFMNDPDLIQQIVIENTHLINSWIDKDIKPLQSKLFPPKIEGVNEKMKTMVYETAHKLYGSSLPSIVEARIKKELDSILNHGYAVVYWISHLLVDKSLSDGYVVGSRGSVGSSLVATLLNITDVNPLPPHYLCRQCNYSNFEVPSHIEDGYDLEYCECPNCHAQMCGEGHNIPFETFLGFNGDKVPDIDLNFSGVYQPRAHNFIREIFGEKNTYRAGTISTIAEKTSFNNVKDYFNAINKEVPLAEKERYAIKCQDVKRTTGQHPGGIIVVPEDMSIYDFTPYNYPADDPEQSWYTTHFAFEYIHDNLLKFDILGHENPTSLRMLKDLTGVDEKDVPVHDPKTMSLFSNLSALNIQPEMINGETTGALSVPEFGTKFVREMLKDTKPQTFADLIRISGLSHGTDVWLGNAKTLISQGHTLKDIIGCRDDIMVYLIQHGIDPSISFQVMEDVRKGKKIKPEHQKILEAKNIPDWYIESCNKIKYMFPKAHATAYVMHAWKFAWYKLNYPMEYYATYFSIHNDIFDLETMCRGYEAIKQKYLSISSALTNPKTKNSVTAKDKELLTLYEIALEMYSRGYKFKMINYKLSDSTVFKIDYETKEIICPFISLNGLGEAVAQSITIARQEHPFISKEDFLKRTKISKTLYQQLIDYHVFDDLKDSNQMSLFDL